MKSFAEIITGWFNFVHITKNLFLGHLKIL